MTILQYKLIEHSLSWLEVKEEIDNDWQWLLGASEDDSIDNEQCRN